MNLAFYAPGDFVIPTSSYGVVVPRRLRLSGLGDGAVAGIPAGSQLSYAAKISASFNPLKASARSLASTIAAVNQDLQDHWHIALLNWADKTPTFSLGVGDWTVALNLQTLVDYGSLADIKSVVDGVFYNAAGASVTSSSMAISSLAAPASTSPTTAIGVPDLVNPPPPPPANVFDFLSQNALWIVAGVVAVVVLPRVLD